MTKRIQKLVAAVAALAALGLGGAVFAQAQSSTTPHAHHHAVRAAGLATAGATDGDTVQSGDQSTPDQPGAAGEQTGAESPEQPGAGSESAAGSDGPGGHADEPGNPNADHQFQGTE
jgi:hypothetical protein